MVAAAPQITEHVTEQHGERDEKEAKCPACKDVLNFAGDAQMFEDHYRDATGKATCVGVQGGNSID